MNTQQPQQNTTGAHRAILNMVYTAVFAALICVCSLLSIQIGQVPITLQTFAVCLAAAVLGWRRGTLSVLVYILLGAVGLPVFAGAAGGVSILAGPTGGYIVGFIPTAFLIGLAADRFGRRALPLAAAMVVGVSACYALGTVWFMIVTGMHLTDALMLCVVPFLIPDGVKIAAAVILADRLYKVVRI